MVAKCPLEEQRQIKLATEGVKHLDIGGMKLEGKKNDDGKLRYDLISAGALEELARVYTIGAKKYSDNNWRAGFRWGRIFAALCRHAWAWWAGERDDPSDGQHHLASVAWCAFTLMEFEKEKKGEDDRWISSPR